MNNRLAIPACRNHITQKIKIASQHTRYASVHDDPRPAEVFLRLEGPDCSSELIGPYEIIARLMSIAVQNEPPPAKVGDLIRQAQSVPYRPESVQDRAAQWKHV
jgi:hypothetical protein